VQHIHTATGGDTTTCRGHTFRESVGFTFEEPGRYYYLCTLHKSMATMHATAVVQ
jgi:plastocyanin